MLEVAHLHIGHGARHGELLLSTHGRNHHVVECVGLVLLQLDVDDTLVALEHHLLCGESHIGEHECLVFLCLDFVLTIDVGDSTQAGNVLYGDAGSYERLARGIGDST